MTLHPTAVNVAVHRPRDVEEAVTILVNAHGAARALAGGTWVMRGEIRGDGYEQAYVLVSELPELKRLGIQNDVLVIGAATTHQRLAAFLAEDGRFGGLATAARKSANPAIRRMATVGGNISTVDFSAADLVPALLVLDASVTIADGSGERLLSITEFLRTRAALQPHALVIDIRVPVADGLSVHERLTLRQAGDYPVSIVDVHVQQDATGVVRNAKVAVGSVEPTARRWPALEACIVGADLDPAAAHDAAQGLINDFNPRDGVEVAGWYRLEVLPTLVGRAFSALQREAQGQ